MSLSTLGREHGRKHGLSDRRREYHEKGDEQIKRLQVENRDLIETSSGESIMQLDLSSDVCLRVKN